MQLICCSERSRLLADSESPLSTQSRHTGFSRGNKSREKNGKQSKRLIASRIHIIKRIFSSFHLPLQIH